MEKNIELKLKELVRQGEEEAVKQFTTKLKLAELEKAEQERVAREEQKRLEQANQERAAKRERGRLANEKAKAKYDSFEEMYLTPEEVMYGCRWDRRELNNRVNNGLIKAVEIAWRIQAKSLLQGESYLAWDNVMQRILEKRNGGVE
ncbi:MAG: hypothetical protein LBC43_03965 [Bifidobacteriaceae bacterium]|jgi:hypothetical protein|nr:hypothetical protein [Bifidobacteriaceae bacterium]